MRAVLVALVMVSAAAILWGGWGRVPEGRVGAWILRVRGLLRPSAVEDRYRLAERYFQAGDFEKSQVQCQRALQMNPVHAPSKALFTEISFILGQCKATTTGSPGVRQEHLLIEIDHALERAERHRAMGEREEALREVRKVQEFAKWISESLELLARRNKADLLEIVLTAP